MGLQVRRNLYTTNQNQTMSLKQIGYVLSYGGCKGGGKGWHGDLQDVKEWNVAISRLV